MKFPLLCLSILLSPLAHAYEIPGYKVDTQKRGETLLIRAIPAKRIALPSDLEEGLRSGKYYPSACEVKRSGHKIDLELEVKKFVSLGDCRVPGVTGCISHSKSFKFCREGQEAKVQMTSATQCYAERVNYWADKVFYPALTAVVTCEDR